jgi:hypothetical protein
MYRRLMTILFMSIIITINAQTINLHGKVTNQDGQPVEGAIVTLVGQNLKDTTGSDGLYTVYREEVSVAPSFLTPRNRVISMHGNTLEFSLPVPSPVEVEIFDIKGNLLKKEFLRNAQA